MWLPAHLSEVPACGNLHPGRFSLKFSLNIPLAQLAAPAGRPAAGYRKFGSGLRTGERQSLALRVGWWTVSWQSVTELSLPLQTLFPDEKCLSLCQAGVMWHWLPLSLLSKLQASIFHQQTHLSWVALQVFGTRVPVEARGWISQGVRCHHCPGAAFPRPAGSRWLFYFPSTA